MIDIDFDAPMEHSPRTWYNYGELLNCTLHTSWPFLRPPIRPLFYFKPIWISFLYAGFVGCTVGASISALFPGTSPLDTFYLTSEVILGVSYCLVYRRGRKQILAEIYREKIGVAVQE